MPVYLIDVYAKNVEGGRTQDGQGAVQGTVDSQRQEAMTQFGKRLIKGLEEAVAIAKGEATSAKVYATALSEPKHSPSAHVSPSYELHQPLHFADRVPSLQQP